MLDRFGSDLPYWDQWSREGVETFVPWLERGELRPHLFKPQNEHRVAPTVGLNLALTLAGGQWDARVQCAVNAALHAALASALFVAALRRLALGWALAFGVVLALLTAPPLAWENVIAGFQSQFYFLTLFSFLAMAALLRRPQGRSSSRCWPPVPPSPPARPGPVRFLRAAPSMGSSCAASATSC